MKEYVQDIIGAGILAPSGDNSQPWEFYVVGNRITLANIPDRDNPILNYRQRGSHVAHGGVIENMVIAAAHYGWASTVTLFPKSDIPHVVAEIILEMRSDVQDDGGLYEYIPQRRTNRKPYLMRPLLDIEAERLVRAGMETVESGGSYDVRFFDHPKTRRLMAEAGSSIERVILENRELHHLLFKDIVWGASEERRRRHGLYVATMEFPWPQRAAFWLASHWPLMKIFTAVGLPKKIVADDARLYASGAAMGLITTKGSEPCDYVQVGRIMQRVWLTSTKMGLSIQPVTALLFAAGRVADGDTWTLTRSHINTIKKNYESLAVNVHLGDETIVMMFRIGFADAPSAASSRMDPVIHLS